MVQKLGFAHVARAAAVICLVLAGIDAASAQAPGAAVTLLEADKADMATVAKSIGKTPYGELDLAEPVHQRYFMKQLELGGFTRADYPKLFATIDEAQKAAVARRAQSGPRPANAIAPKLIAPASDAATPIVPVVNIVNFGPDPYSQAFIATVQLSVPGDPNLGVPVALTSIGMYDQNNNLFGLSNGISQNYAGFDVRNSVIGVPASPPTQVTLQGSYYYIDVKGEPHSGAIFAQLALPIDSPAVVVPRRIAPAEANQIISNLQPTDIDKNNVIKVCVVRQDADCDYKYGQTNGQYIVKFPIQGSVTFPVALQPIAQQQANGVVSINVTQANPSQGGACTLPANFNFWQYATINGSVLSWLIDPGPFSNPSTAPNNPCFPSSVNQQGVSVVYNLYVSAIGTNSSFYPATITSAQIAPPPNNTLVIFPMQVSWGCVQEGSLVALPDGGSIPIEKLVPGQKVVAAGGRELDVRGLTRGDETLPMVRINTANGHSLLLTETHPVLTAEGPVMAKSLTAGQVVITEQGPSVLVSTGREPGGKVWNIALAATNAAGLDGPDEGFFANGVLVGDSAAQQRAELRERIMLAERQQQMMPAEWRTDAESARRRAAQRL